MTFAGAAPGRIVSPHVEWFALSPLLVLVGGAVVLLVLSVLTPKLFPRGAFAGTTIAVAGTAIVLSFINWNHVRDDGAKSLVNGAIALDGAYVFPGEIERLRQARRRDEAKRLLGEVIHACDRAADVGVAAHAVEAAQ